MFGGVGGEVLWKPVDQSWGIGADINWVAQRDYDDPFGFDYYNYDVVTGHASLYWDTGFYDLEAQVDAGRYLAGDWGGTVTLTRRFPNGWAVGGYFTLTDVTEEDFGEGSFDKGVFVEVPFRWTVPFETRANNAIALHVGVARRRRPARHLERALSDRPQLRPQPAVAQLGVLLAMRRPLSRRSRPGAGWLLRRRVQPDRRRRRSRRSCLASAAPSRRRRRCPLTRAALCAPTWRRSGPADRRS